MIPDAGKRVIVTELYYIWLECIKGLGPVSWHFLLDAYGSPFEIYQNRMQLSPQGRVTDHCLELMRKDAEEALEKARGILDQCEKQGIRIVKYSDLEFKDTIRQKSEFPILFYYKGTLKENWTNGAGMIGARRCSPEGKAYAIKTTVQMVEKGYPIISGMAKGIDSYAHTAAINHGGYTIAVLGFGIDRCYPVEHRKLKEIIAEKGLLLSEYPPGTQPCRFRFPERNRIIAGLSDVLYVIDTRKNSGTQTTIQAAKKYGKEILINTDGSY